MKVLYTDSFVRIILCHVDYGTVEIKFNLKFIIFNFLSLNIRHKNPELIVTSTNLRPTLAL